MKNLHKNQKMDKVGRILFPKALRVQYNLNPGDEIALFEHVDADKNVFLCLAPANVATKENYLTAASVLDELGLDIPNELMDLIGE